MQFPCWMSPVRRVSFLGAAAFLAASLVSAQSTIAPNQSSAPRASSGESSSLQFAELADPGSLSAEPAEPSAAGGSSAAAAQSSGDWRHHLRSNFAFEAGGGFNAPDSDSVTYGGQFTVGAGMHINPRFATMIEYQFLDDKLPGALIAETGATGGHAHIWSLTVDPVISLFPKSSNDIYVTGGGGFYRKVSSFTDPEPSLYCDYFYGCGIITTNQVVGHFSSNQGGWNVGAGFQHRLGGMYGDSKTSLFVEARFVDVLTPAVSGITPNGLGVTTVAADTKMIPVNFGIRF